MGRNRGIAPEEWYRLPRDGRCSVCIALEQMPEEDAARTRRALSSKLGAQPIADGLRKAGYQTGRWVVNRHRREGHKA